MPNDLSITSYGHCYYVLIIAHLFKSGIAKSDDEINACLNFAENLAFKIYCKGSGGHRIGSELVDELKKEYKRKFIIKESTLNRLFNSDYGIVTGNRQFQFRNPYMYYFFLGRYLANNREKHKDVIQGMIDKSFITSNCLTLIFTIHHTNDDDIIEDILIRTMCTLENIVPSTLEEKETKVFEAFIKGISPKFGQEIRYNPREKGNAMREIVGSVGIPLT